MGCYCSSDGGADGAQTSVHVDDSESALPQLEVQATRAPTGSSATQQPQQPVCLRHTSVSAPSALASMLRQGNTQVPRNGCADVVPSPAARCPTPPAPRFPATSGAAAAPAAPAAPAAAARPALEEAAEATARPLAAAPGLSPSSASPPPAADAPGERPVHAQRAAGGLLATFALGRRLGRGHFAEVRECVHRATGARYAVKMLLKAELSATRRALVRREIEVMERLPEHPNVLDLKVSPRRCLRRQSQTTPPCSVPCATIARMVRRLCTCCRRAPTVSL